MKAAAKLSHEVGEGSFFVIIQGIPGTFGFADGKSTDPKSRKGAQAAYRSNSACY